MLKKLLNLPEQLTHARLKDFCEECKASVHAKVRLADIFPIENSGISVHDYRFALQSHFDFVITNSETEPLFAVEFDGPMHETPVQRSRDSTKDQLCKRFEFPLLRINSSFLTQKYRNLDLLSWFVQIWFLHEDFIKQQAKGVISQDEIFDPWATGGIPGAKEKFPYWLSAPILIKIRKLHEDGRCKDRTPSYIVGIGADQNYHIICWICIDENSGVFATAEMSNQHFPVSVSELLTDLIVYDLYEDLTEVLMGRKPAHKLDDIQAEIDHFKQSFTFLSSIGSGTSV